MKQFKGFIRWFDKTGNDGIITCLETGSDYYFNSYSDKETVYIVTGTCKDTGLEKTIETRQFPGLFLNYTLKSGSQVDRWTYDTPVRFNQASGIDQRWAVDVSIDESLSSEVEEYHLVALLDSLLACELGQEQSSVTWKPHYERRLESLLSKGA